MSINERETTVEASRGLNNLAFFKQLLPLVNFSEKHQFSMLFKCLLSVNYQVIALYCLFQSYLSSIFPVFRFILKL